MVELTGGKIEPDSMAQINEMNMVEILSEELGDKEVRIMGHSTDPEDKEIWDEVLSEINESDWNDDRMRSELYMDDDFDIFFRHKSCYVCDTTEGLLILQAGGSQFSCQSCIDNGMEVAEIQIRNYFGQN